MQKGIKLNIFADRSNQILIILIVKKYFVTRCAVDIMTNDFDLDFKQDTQNGKFPN